VWTGLVLLTGDAGVTLAARDMVAAAGRAAGGGVAWLGVAKTAS
jgi:hypothetical protein